MCPRYTQIPALVCRRAWGSKASATLPMGGIPDRVLDIDLAMVHQFVAIGDGQGDIAPGAVTGPVVVLGREPLRVRARPMRGLSVADGTSGRDRPIGRFDAGHS